MISRGSEWRRWEPHIHAPGTVMNNQFSGPNAWHDYLSALEAATPTIEAIAVTDYYVTETYQEVLEHKKNGRLSSVELVFPNIELRLDVATAKGGFVNLHLFVSPEDPGHLEQLDHERDGAFQERGRRLRNRGWRVREQGWQTPTSE